VAAREFKPGEGSPEPTAKAKVPRAERSAARKERTTDMAKANKAGQLPVFGEGDPNKK
jgi:hypothetical protein